MKKAAYLDPKTLKHLSACEAKTVETELLKKYPPVRLSRNRATNERNDIINNNPNENSSQNTHPKSSKQSTKISNVDQLASALGIIL